MTDKELLELAAKAAGVEGDWFENEFWSGIQGTFTGNADVRPWNPLTDDGDALRLVVRLKLIVDVGPGYAEVKDPEHDPDPIRAFEYSNDSDNPYAATRRAIVRAAAEIGRTM